MNLGGIDSGETLSCGSTCLKNGCAACCAETEMPLTKEDVKRIEKLGFKRISFIIEAEGETRLRNVRGVCFFLDGMRCRIYGSRPEGCRIYPLVYDVETHEFVYDSVCFHSNEFKVRREDKTRLKRLIRKLETEATRRV
jgi:Fe-S-cluster containining protein